MHRQTVIALAIPMALATTLGWPELPGAAERFDGSAYEAVARDPSVRQLSIGEVLERLIVTARRREERAQQVPVAVTPLSAAELRRANRDRRLEDVQPSVPNLIFDSAIGLANTERLLLRGVGEGDPTPTSDPGVGVYVDGIYLSRSTGLSFAPFDVERVEVLRGPQGTLFGKNTPGGAINVFTRKPEFDFGGELELRAGNFDTFDSRLALNMPFPSERTALRVSLASATADGYVKNRFTGGQLADNKLLGARVQLLSLPSDDVEVLLGFGYTRENRNPLGGKCVAVGPGAGVAGLLAQQSGALAACREDAGRDELSVSSDLGFARDALLTRSLNAQVTWDITPDLTLVSLSGVRRGRVERFADLDFTAVPLFQAVNDGGREFQDQWSQELQLMGRTDGGALSFVAGVYALGERVDSRGSTALDFGSLSNGNRTDPDPLVTREDLDIRNWSYAVYGQAVYSLTSRIDLTFGARFTAERKSVERELTRRFTSETCSPLCVAVSSAPDPFTGFDRSARFSNVSPMATLSYAWSPKLLAYVSYGTAFLSGGFQGRASRLADTRKLDPQELTSYEVGLKGTFFEDRLLLNASYFYNVLENSRISFTNGTDDLGLVNVSERNAAETLIRGGELELIGVAWPGLQLRANLGVLRSEFREFSKDVTDPAVGSGTPPGTPNYTMNFVADYERSVGAFGSLALRASWTHRGRMQSDAQATDALEVGKVGLLDGRLAWMLPDERTELAVYGSNLLDRRYFSNGLSFADSFGIAARFYAPPRRYGVELRRRF